MIPAQRRSLLRLSLIALFFTLIVGFILWGSVKTHSIQSVQQTLNLWRPWISAIRWICLLVVVAAWPSLCRYSAKSLGLCTQKTRTLANARWRMALWLILLEVVLGQNGLSTLCSLFQVSITGANL